MKQIQAYFLCLTVFLLFLLYALPYTLYPVPALAQCQTNSLNQGLISATEGLGSGTALGNNEQVCITGTDDASYRAFKVPLYQNLEDQFYTQSRVSGSVKKAPDTLSGSTWNFDRTGNGIYLQTGSVTLTSVVPKDTTTPGVQVIFIRGNLDIKDSIEYADLDSNSGLVFIVSGNINIDPLVKKINAVLISTGNICTAWNFSTQSCLNGQTETPQLVINGSLISLNENGAINLARSLNFNNQPAEVINKQPKYLYILRGILTQDLIITTEDQHYIIPSAPPGVEGGWTNWSPAVCPVACGRGTQTRTCNNPAPAGDGLQCLKEDGTRGLSETKACNTQACPSSCFSGNPLSISTIFSIGGSCIISIN